MPLTKQQQQKILKLGKSGPKRGGNRTSKDLPSRSEVLTKQDNESEWLLG
jgi:hypothetical protein